MDVSLGSDGQCTGFPSSLFQWNWLHCCVTHDMGGSDKDLFLCIASVLPLWAVPTVFTAVLVMKAGRPFYNYLQRKGWVK